MLLRVPIVRRTPSRLLAPIRFLLVVILIVELSVVPHTARAAPRRDAGWTMWIEVLRVWHLMRWPPVDRNLAPHQWAATITWRVIDTVLSPLFGWGDTRRLLGIGLANLTQTHSLGLPSCGSLHEPRELVEDPDAYHLRHTSRVFGTPHLVVHVRRAIEHVRTERPDVHPLAIGDLSIPRGGWLPGHRSHQSGRDIDLGLYFREPPPIYPDRFAHGKPDNLDPEATWLLLTGLARSRSRPGGAQYVLLDHHVQRIVFGWALSQGIPRRKLRDILQYPREPDVREGFVRHFDGHHDHLHVRFACPPGDPLCLD